MFTIGILGDEYSVASKVLVEIFKTNAMKFSFCDATDKDQVRAALMAAIIKKSKVLVLNMHLGQGYDTLKSLKFDILIFLIKEEKEELALTNLLKPKNYLIINSDSKLPKKIFLTDKSVVITCGFKQNSSITVSSVDCELSNKIQCSLQRTLIGMDGGKIEPQEVEYTKIYQEEHIESVLVAIAAAMLAGAKV